MTAIEVLHKINDTVDRCPLCGESRRWSLRWNGWMPGEIAHTTTCPMGAVLARTPPRSGEAGEVGAPMRREPRPAGGEDR